MQRWEEEAMLKREGREEGFSEGVEFLILKMLKSNLPIKQIAAITDKTIEEIQSIARTQ